MALEGTEDIVLHQYKNKWIAEQIELRQKYVSSIHVVQNELLKCDFVLILPVYVYHIID